VKNSKTKIRNFSPSDLKEVIWIEKISFPNRKPYSEDYFKSLYQKYPEGFIVAKGNKGEIRGYTIGQSKNESAEIISLAVDPIWRKKGIGKTLTNFLINNFKEKGVKEISLHVRIKNKAGITLYQNLGFQILKTIKNYYSNGDDAYLMKRNLGA